jgi:Na+-translocating ferredoxin:NAD+ oxidoreductase RnfA subunit
MSLAFIPVLTVAVSNVQQEQVGLESGLVNTGYQIGFALVLAIMVTWSSGRSEKLIASGIPHIEALNNGFHLTFIGAAIVSTIGTLLVLYLHLHF